MPRIGRILGINPSRQARRISSVEGTYVIRLFLLGGGGGGCTGASGTGGAGGTGGEIFDDYIVVTKGESYDISIGEGGNAAPNAQSLGGFSYNGGKTSFGPISVLGGTCGISPSSISAIWPNGAAGSTGSNTAGITGINGTKGGNGSSNSGGGGASAAGNGGNASSGVGGNGADGYEFPEGSGEKYGAGGGGGAPTGSTAGTGGDGGGADGQDTAGTPSAAPDNKGGGGGGGTSVSSGSKGGSGVAKAMYEGPPRGSGGVITQSNGWTTHTFNSDGTFVA